MAVIFVFADGVGLAEAGTDNPLSDAATPALRGLLGGPLTLEQVQRRAGLLLSPIDATLDVPGLPQSGTGQTALLAGFNAAAAHGRHQPHVPPVALRAPLAEQSVFARLTRRGGRATFANAFGAGYWEALRARRVRRSASVIAAEGAGLRFRDEADLRAGRAVAWDVTGEAHRAQHDGAAPVPPRAAGAALAALAADHDLVFFETFLPDLAGHGRWLAHQAWSAEEQVQAALERLDGLLDGILAARRASDTLLLTSDHGNVESRSAPAHTRNPVPLLAVGPDALRFESVASIADVADALLAVVAPAERSLL